MMYRIALCDMHKAMSDELGEVLTEAFANLSCTCCIEALADEQMLIRKIEDEGRSYNIIFLNVPQGDVPSFLAARRLREVHRVCILIFISESMELAAEGYKYGAFRWVIRSRLGLDVNEAICSLVGHHRTSLAGKELLHFKILDDHDYDYIHIREQDIIQFVKINRRVVLVTVQGNYELLKYTLMHYKERMNSSNFVVVSRSHLINLYHVKAIKGDFFQLSNSDAICLGSKEHVKKQVKEDYMNYINCRRLLEE